MSEVTKSVVNRVQLLIAVVVLLGLIILGLFAYKFIFSTSLPQNDKLMALEKTLQDIRAAMNVDSVRQYSIQKIMKIIDQYNPDMPSNLKYEIADEIYKMSVKYENLDIDLICATITYETGRTWNPETVSKAGAMGLMQIMPNLGIWIAYYEGITWTSPEDVLFNPIYNIRIGCRYLSTLINSYQLEGGLAAYNGGEKRAAIWLANNKAEGILLTETSNYIPNVLKLYQKFKDITVKM
ncbi:MAG: hypothetical protein D6813_10920 [Calditrichaeota bacterium]|nr:MAG: hypothetical protein D6813_10920 [Calditrichota bacterium]